MIDQHSPPAANPSHCQLLGYLWRAVCSDPRRTLTAHRNAAAPGTAFERFHETETYTVQHTLVDGIERIVYRPKTPRFETPLWLQHGMWHGAWCWQPWQERFVAWGWTSVASSLPGHGASPAQRPVAACTLDYYLGFVGDEIERLPRRPVYIGHSMGGALAQWYLKFVADDLPAAVLTAPWIANNIALKGLPRLVRLMPAAPWEMARAGTAAPMVATPQRAAAVLLGERAVVSPEELYARLGPESVLVLLQHNWPFWRPPRDVRTPILWLGAEKDTLIGLADARRSARHYRADFVTVEDAGHNLMHEWNAAQTAETIHAWLVEQHVP